jgi:hypothetical protein
MFIYKKYLMGLSPVDLAGEACGLVTYKIIRIMAIKVPTCSCHVNN